MKLEDIISKCMAEGKGPAEIAESLRSAGIKDPEGAPSDYSEQSEEDEFTPPPALNDRAGTVEMIKRIAKSKGKELED